MVFWNIEEIGKGCVPKLGCLGTSKTHIEYDGKFLLNM